MALFAGERSKPLKKLGGGGRRDVSGTADSQSCCFWAAPWEGGGPVGGAYSGALDDGELKKGLFLEEEGGGPAGGA